MPSEPIITAMLAANKGRLLAVAGAFARLIEGSWSDAGAVSSLRRLDANTSDEGVARTILEAFDAIQRESPTVNFWWKDESSVFLGCCRRLSATAGLDVPGAIIGIPEADERLAWSRQGNLYRRDDREVFESNAPKLNILERQDRPDGVTVWLRTSKVPYQSAVGGGTVGGFDSLTDAQAQAVRRRGV